MIRLITLRYENYHALPSTCQQHAIRILQIVSVLQIIDVLPFGPSKVVEPPTQSIETQVAIPSDNSPIDL